MSERPLVLLSNDDGVQAKGIRLLFEAMSEDFDTFMVAPERDQSATSHALSLHKALRHREVEDRVHALDGTPADCVYVGLFHPRILPRKPDLVVSGLNHGPNLAGDVHYSGTVAAAREGALRGIPSMAFSAANEEVMEAAVPLAVAMVRRLYDATPPRVATPPEDPAQDEQSQVPLLNVNFPVPPIRGVRATRLGIRDYRDEISVRLDPRGREYLWLGGPGPEPHRSMHGSDTEASDEGVVSVTPLRMGLTHAGQLGVASYVVGPQEIDS